MYHKSVQFGSFGIRHGHLAHQDGQKLRGWNWAPSGINLMKEFNAYNKMYFVQYNPCRRMETDFNKYIRP